MLSICRTCSKEFEITSEDLRFYEKVSPVFAGKKELVPPPTRCPDCRKQRRTSWRNDRLLYSRSCGLCGRRMISLYSPDKPYNVYCYDCWWSDKWDPHEHAQDFDFTRTFAEQFQPLQLNTPRIAFFNTNSENSEYSNNSARNKNCYMVCACFDSENVYHSRMIRDSRDVLDSTSCVEGCELCYECSQCEKCYNLKYSFNCKGCIDSAFLYDCHNCRNCYRSTGLRNKQFCFENKQYTKEEWSNLIPDLGSYRTLEAEGKKNSTFLLGSPHLFANFINCDACTGDDLIGCHNCLECYDVRDGEDCKFFERGDKAKDCYDCFGAGNPAELLYEVGGMLSGYHTVVANMSYFGSMLFYCDSCQNSANLFGCVGLKKAECCIFNKQHKKTDYDQLVPKIINHMRKTGEWGEFFPPDLSPYGYNESAATEYYPLSKEQARASGFKWCDYQAPKADPLRVINGEGMNHLPDHIEDIPEEVVDWALTCQVSGKPYRIIKQELKFYQNNNLAFPRVCPDQRFTDRISRSNRRKLWQRRCSKCSADIVTTFDPTRPEAVYCEKCYLRFVD
jgi:hypothetical protein